MDRETTVFDFVDRARRAQEEINRLTAPTTDGGSQGAGEPPNSPAPPLTVDELDALVTTIWDGLDEDPTRFDELLFAAVAFIGRLALEARPPVSTSAVVMLRAMEHRALWGPDLEQEDHR